MQSFLHFRISIKNKLLSSGYKLVCGQIEESDVTFLLFLRDNFAITLRRSANMYYTLFKFNVLQVQCIAGLLSDKLWNSISMTTSNMYKETIQQVVYSSESSFSSVASLQCLLRTNEAAESSRERNSTSNPTTILGPMLPAHRLRTRSGCTTGHAFLNTLQSSSMPITGQWPLVLCLRFATVVSLLNCVH